MISEIPKTYIAVNVFECDFKIQILPKTAVKIKISPMLLGETGEIELLKDVSRTFINVLTIIIPGWADVTFFPIKSVR